MNRIHGHSAEQRCICLNGHLSKYPLQLILKKSYMGNTLRTILDHIWVGAPTAARRTAQRVRRLAQTFPTIPLNLNLHPMAELMWKNMRSRAKYSHDQPPNKL